MADTASGSSNTYAGGINFSSTIGGSGGGTVNFDLPLATIANFNNRAFDFLASNSERNKSFLAASMARNDAAVQQTSATAFDYLNRGLSTIRTGNIETGKALTDINAVGQQQSIFRSLFAAQANQPKSGGGGCFITTAICEAEGKPDNCDELQTLRQFRDEVMLKDSRLSSLVREYYEIAPSIVEAIKKLPDPAALFGLLRMQYLDRAIAAVKAGDTDEAVGEYLQMVAVARQMAGA